MWAMDYEGEHAKYLKQIKQERLQHLSRVRQRFHLKRVPVEIKLTGQSFGAAPVIIPARVFSCDFRADSMRVMATDFIAPWQEVSVSVIETETTFYAKGFVSFCKLQEIRMSVIMPVHYTYRVEVQFLYDTKKDRDHVEKYVASFVRRNLEAGNLVELENDPTLRKVGIS